MSDPVSIVWFRHDLRLRDNPALAAATRAGAPVVPVFLWPPWPPGQGGAWPPGAASRYWLHHSLLALDADLRRLGSRLVLRRGPEAASETEGLASAQALAALAREVGARAVYWNRQREPAAARIDAPLVKALESAGLAVHVLPLTLLFAPEDLRTSSGGPYRVFTPYYRACLARYRHQDPLAAPRRVPAPARWPRSLRLAQLELEPRVAWADGIRLYWDSREPTTRESTRGRGKQVECERSRGFGERAALRRLRAFAAGAAARYETTRDRLDQDGTSRLSPHLHFGEVSPRQVWDAIGRLGTTRAFDSADAFLRQIIWREFAHHLLHHFPEMPEKPLRPEFARMPWRRSRSDLRAWQRGETGYPIVDAAMRQLWETGWMHNRARMIVASFLVKDLLLPWQAGARWFWDTLVDADLANNTFGWQWVAGCGADAAPFFRIFNPVLQGRKFDPDGAYVCRYLPELRGVPARWIHAPWEAPSAELRKAGVKSGKEYPRPIVDHALARERALEAYARIRAH